MKNNKNIYLKIEQKDKVEIGVITGVTIVSMYALAEIIGTYTYGIAKETGDKIKNKYTKWKLKRTYKKIMKNPNVDNDAKKELKESTLGKFIESL